jgi:hypothetical protein
LKLAALAKRTSTGASQLTTVLNEHLLTLHAHPASCRDLARTCLQHSGSSQRRPEVHPGSDPGIGGDALAQLIGAQLRRGRHRQRQARVETGQRAVFVGRRVVATQVPRCERAKPAAAQMTLHPVLVGVIRQHPKRRIQTADVVRRIHAPKLCRCPCHRRLEHWPCRQKPTDAGLRRQRSDRTASGPAQSSSPSSTTQSCDVYRSL